MSVASSNGTSLLMCCVKQMWQAIQCEGSTASHVQSVWLMEKLSFALFVIICSCLLSPVLIILYVRNRKCRTLCDLEAYGWSLPANHLLAETVLLKAVHFQHLVSYVGLSQHMLDITRVMTGSFVQSPSQSTVLHDSLGHRELNHKHILFL